MLYQCLSNTLQLLLELKFHYRIHKYLHLGNVVQPEKLMVVGIAKKFSICYGNRNLFHDSAPQLKPLLRSTPADPVSLRPILILSFHIRLALRGIFPSGVPLIPSSTWYNNVNLPFHFFVSIEKSFPEYYPHKFVACSFFLSSEFPSFTVFTALTVLGHLHKL
jgi:hypothetical protein